jgi:hypothetical protein
LFSCRKLRKSLYFNDLQFFPASAEGFDCVAPSNPTTLVYEWGAIITSFSVRSIDSDVLFINDL